jgi:proteasome lid subunit RPN8/RPN11
MRLHGREPNSSQVRILVSQAALRQVNLHSSSNTNAELGGALLGNAFHDDRQPVVEIVAALPAVTVDHGPVHFTFTADAWSQLHRDREARYPELAIVGWFHTHPDLGIFFSPDDVVVQSAAFVLPWHVGLVVDPVRQEGCFFGWKLDANGHTPAETSRREIEPIPGFYERLDQQRTTMVGWRVTHSLEWRAAEMLDRAGRVFTPDAYRPALRPVSGWLGAVSGGLALLLAFFFLVAGVLPLSRQVRDLQQVVTTLTGANGTANAACASEELRILAPLPGSAVVGGTTQPIIGTANQDDARRYSLETRPAGAQSWTALADFRRDRVVAKLGEWNTAGYGAGVYELRLRAEGTAGKPMPGESCTIAIELTR